MSVFILYLRLRRRLANFRSGRNRTTRPFFLQDPSTGRSNDRLFYSSNLGSTNKFKNLVKIKYRYDVYFFSFFFLLILVTYVLELFYYKISNLILSQY